MMPEAYGFANELAFVDADSLVAIARNSSAQTGGRSLALGAMLVLKGRKNAEYLEKAFAAIDKSERPFYQNALGGI